jgi:ABC-type antimicrobial peptide transport system permease subunit
VEEAIKLWQVHLKTIQASPRTLDIHSEGINAIYESYHSLDHIYDLNTTNEIMEKLEIYSRLYSIIQIIKNITRDAHHFGHIQTNLEWEGNINRCREIFEMLKSDISFLKAQFISNKQENIMNNQLEVMQKQIKQIERQMKISKITLAVAIVSLIVVIIFSLIQLA